MVLVVGWFDVTTSIQTTRERERERSRTIGCVSVCDAEPTALMLPLDELLIDDDGSVIGERSDQANQLTSKTTATSNDIEQQMSNQTKSDA